MRDLVPMTLADFEGAPFHFSARATLSGTADAVFDELGDPSLWFPLMRRSVWRTGATSGVDAQREVDMLGFGKFRERMLAWDRGKRVAFTMTATSSPLIARMGEDWRLTQHPDHTDVEWIVVAYPSLIGRPITPVLRIILGRMFGIARGGLAKRTEWSHSRLQGKHVS
jgi:hypothetical protein